MGFPQRLLQLTFYHPPLPDAVALNSGLRAVGLEPDSRSRIRAQGRAAEPLATCGAGCPERARKKQPAFGSEKEVGRRSRRERERESRSEKSKEVGRLEGLCWHLRLQGRSCHLSLSRRRAGTGLASSTMRPLRRCTIGTSSSKSICATRVCRRMCCWASSRRTDISFALRRGRSESTVVLVLSLSTLEAGSVVSPMIPS
jgi:hypothetical protein